ncbi:VanZ like protein [Bacillus oleivorans]|uniref:VanZ like protein n=1 Tax=Bacillus oleivorans TaxID=1448271 RepID=A0A285CHL9_9BACI|nr:VanZ family protein [Bacillus oleivorans]SNX67000.1 VanZ like protein [Bacillus oleivorans]
MLQCFTQLGKERGTMRLFFRWLLILSPFLYMGLIWVLSSLPHDAIIRVSDNEFDKWFKESLHLIEFGILYCFIVFFFIMIGKFSLRSSRFAAVWACLYGVIDELHQYTVPYRSFAVIDLVKDFIGVFVCYMIITRTFFASPPKQPGLALKKIQVYLTGSNK